MEALSRDRNDPTPLAERYDLGDRSVFDEADRQRLASAPDEVVAWEILYRREPELYERLIAGEKIHPDVMASLPKTRRAVEVGAGTGRLTTELCTICDELVAVEPAEPLRRILEEKTSMIPNVSVRPGRFDSIPLPDGWADMAVSCSAFTAEPERGGEAGLEELERVTRKGGIIAFVWPSDVGWLTARGFRYESFEGEMEVCFSSSEEAVFLARVFYPDAVPAIEKSGSACVPYEVLGMNPPRDIAWKAKS